MLVQIINRSHSKPETVILNSDHILKISGPYNNKMYMISDDDGGSYKVLEEDVQRVIKAFGGVIE